MALATGQITINNIKETIQVTFSKDNHVFAGSISAALAGSEVITVKAFVGSTQVACTIGTITPARPTGLTLTAGTGTGLDKTITMAATTSLTQASGSYTIPITLTASGIVVNKVLSYSIAFKGATGKGISSTAITYQAHTNGTTAPTGTWLADPPAVADNQFLWTKTVITYTDAATSTLYSVGKMGGAGPAGKGISSTVITYQAGVSGTIAPTGTWTPTIPEVTSNEFLWTKILITYSDASTSTSYSVGKIGATGRSVISLGEEFYLSDSEDELEGGEWLSYPPKWVIGKYLWSRALVTYSDSEGVPAALIPVRITGAPLKAVSITPSSTMFKSTNGGVTFAPDYIALLPVFQGTTYKNWEYTIDGGTNWNPVTIETDQLDIDSVTNMLTIPKTTTLFTVSTTVLTFRVNSVDLGISSTISITKLYDIIDLTQQQIFNKLTNNGTQKGLFIQDNQLYLNANYVKTGETVTDKLLVENGFLNNAVIKNASIESGKINTLDAGKITTGLLKSSDGSSWIDLDTGEFQFGGEAIRLTPEGLLLDGTADPGTGVITGGTTLGEILNGKLAASALTDLQNYFTYNPTDGVKISATEEIGGATIINTVQIVGSGINFINNGQTVAYIQDQRLFIKDATIVETFIVNSHQFKKYNSDITIVTWLG